MSGSYYSYLSPKLESRSHPMKGGCGVFAREPIDKDEIVVMWGGRVLTAGEIDLGMPNFTQQVLQIDDDLYLLSPTMEPTDCFNHSCEPNVGMSGQVGLIAMREIAAGEEVCLDYAMCDGSDYDEFECTCGSPGCRGRVTGNDWKRPDLWDRYEGYFSPYLQRRIDRLKHEARQTTATALR